MATRVSKAKTKDNLKAVHHIDRVNLYDFGYEKAGNVKGDPDVFEAFLERIKNGDLVEEKYKGLTDDEKKEMVKVIKDLEKQKREQEKENAVVEAEIKEKEKTIEKHRNELLQIREMNAKNKELLKKETFSPFIFSLNLFLLVFLSVYLFFFYISASYKALYVDFEAIAEAIAQGAGTGSIMPGPGELGEALQYNYLLFLIPFVFYAFGWTFHVLLEMKHKFKSLFLSGLIIVTFIVDFLLAMIIHNNTESAKELMGLATTSWTSSSTFYIILFLGFLVYIIWSILLHSLLTEWSKKQVTNNLNKIIKHMKKDIEILTKKLHNIPKLENQINNYREDISTVFYGSLKSYIDQFTSGWLSYLAPANMKELKEKCLLIKKDFEEKNDISKGIVKVVGKRM